MTMRVDYAVAMEVASHEAVIRQAYKDSVGKWTWSVGLTSATGHDVERYIGKPQTIQHCMNVYVWALENYADAVREVFKGHTLTRAQFAAALSFHWNTGAIKRAAWVKHFKAGRMAEAKRAFMAWNKPSEIVGRRAKEAALLFDGVWSNNGTMTEYTRLTSRSTPVFSSAVKINVEKELRAAFAKRVTPVLDTAPQPDAKVAAPTLSPPAPETEAAPAAPVPVPAEQADELLRRLAAEAAIKPARRPSPEVMAKPGFDLDLWYMQFDLKEMNYSPGGLDGLWGGLTGTAMFGFITDRELPIAAPQSYEMFQAIRDALKAEIDKAIAADFKKPVTQERAEASDATVAKSEPAIVPAKRNFLSTALASIGTFLAAFFTALRDHIAAGWAFIMGHKDQLPEDSWTYAGEIWKYVGMVPVSVWLTIIGIGLAYIGYNSWRGAKMIRESVRSGERA